jgi:hypothetical protein
MVSPCGKNATDLNHLASQETVPVAAVPCHSILVLFPDKLLEPSVVTLHDAVQKIVAFDFIRLQDLRGICFCVPKIFLAP